MWISRDASSGVNEACDLWAQLPNRTASAPRPVVALLVETSNSYSRGLLQGIRDYFCENEDWTILLSEQGRGNLPPPWLRHWRGDGMIARIETKEIERIVRAAKSPVVNVSVAGLAPEFPAIIPDSAALTRLAAEHLLERGFRHFAFCGDSRFPWSARLARYFVAYLSEAGYGCDVFESTPTDFRNWRQEQRKLAEWIRSLPRPVGIMAYYDLRGQEILDVCRLLDIHVPEEVAVIGQPNDDLLCNLSRPPLSSVTPNACRAGYEAARLLESMMQGKHVAARLYEVEPLGVATRQSTDVAALADRQIASAVRFIRENASRGIGVDDVLKVVPMSRRLLERKFRQLLGRGPYEEILRVRVGRAKELLLDRDMSVADVADRLGFSSPEYLSAAFKKQVGLNPRQFRAEHLATGKQALMGWL